MDRVTLPSGRSVTIIAHSDPKRPWDAYESGGMYVIQRERLGARGQSETFSGQRVSAMAFERVDAEELVRILNSRPARRSRLFSGRRDPPSV